MIREIGLELQAQLRAQGVPIDVVTGPEASTTSTWGRERIVIEYDTDATDSFGPPRLNGRNPRHRHLADEACKITIYVQSSVAGPNVFEHRRRAKHARDAVISALDHVAAATGRMNRWKPIAGRFITPASLAANDKPGGAVYELKFTFDRAIEDRTWAGATNAEATLASGTIHSTTRVSRAQGADDDDNESTPPATAELACGA